MPPAFASAREKRLWLWSVVCTLAIYLSLYPVRPLADWLRERNLLRLTIGLLFVTAAVAVVLWVARRGTGRRELTVLAAVAVVYLAVLWPIRMPEERFHLIEYGVLGGLLYGALLERRRPGAAVGWAAAPAVTATALAGLAGWLDEGIQRLLPNRHYDWSDVALNLLAAALAVAALAAAGEARFADRAGLRSVAGR